MKEKIKKVLTKVGYHFIITFFIISLIILTFLQPFLNSKIKTGPNSSYIYGMGGGSLTMADNIAFSPDGNTLAYTWQTSKIYYPFLERPRTLTDKVDVIWFALNNKDSEQSVLVDSVNLGYKGKTYFQLQAKLFFSPDSKHIAVLCSKRILIINLITSNYAKLEYEGENFGSVGWLSNDQIIFTTTYEDKLTFWKYKIGNSFKERESIYIDKYEKLSIQYPELRKDNFSPDGKYVIINRGSIIKNDPAQSLFNLRSGSIKDFLLSIYDICWKPDGTAFVTYESEDWDKGGGKYFVLYDLINDTAIDLTKEFSETFGKGLNVDFASEFWTPDEKYMLVYKTDSFPPKDKHSGWYHDSTGYMIQPDPFKIILKNDRIIRRSPIPGWVLLQGDNDFDWINYDGTQTIKLEGWPNNWIWSPDSVHAAKVAKDKVVVFNPVSPRSNLNSTQR